MVFNRFDVRIGIRLALLFLVMPSLALIIGKEARLFSILSISILMLLLVLELFRTLTRTNRTVESPLESIRHGDHNRNIEAKVAGMGFETLAESAQGIIRAIASARIEKETQYQYLLTILEHVHSAVLTLDESSQPELINPLALNILGLYTSKKPSWKEVEKAVPPFAKAVQNLGASGREMVRLSGAPTGRKLLVLATTVKIGGKPVKIVTFQDIEPEIDQKELESWQTISRIMAHEIMNSLTPLSSLTETGIMLLERDGKAKEVTDLTQETINNLHTALKTISDRNQALAQFIGNYRQLSRLPLPNKKEVRVSQLFEEFPGLYSNQLQEKGVRLTIHPVSGKHTIRADMAQVKQVLINLVKNAMEALDHSPGPEITLKAMRILDHMAIEVSDNGPGIPADVLEKIFVPFYSTKQEGSGIGLSLSRQIVQNHGGQIVVRSREGKGTTFRITFPVG